MDKNILIQNIAMKAEIKDIRSRIKKLERQIGNLDIVSDVVKGSREDYSQGLITVKGFPLPAYKAKTKLLNQQKELLEESEKKLTKLTIEAEEFINGVENSEIRTMFRCYYMDGDNWIKVAHRMNSLFSGKTYTQDSCRMKVERFLEKF